MAKQLNQPIVSMKGISKEFNGVYVLKNVDFNIYKGRVMALIGENGAGKSTLMKILTGVYEKTEGEILLQGKPVNFHDTKESQDGGIAFIHQELNLIKDLSIAENIYLGREPVTSTRRIQWKKLNEDAKKWLTKLGLTEDPRELVKNISIGKQQLVEIAKALSINAEVIIMDEPTGALTPQETEKLFEVIRELRKDGKSVVYISHRLQEILAICDDITVLRDGELIEEREVEQIDEDTIIEMMVGRKLSEQYPRVDIALGEEAMNVKDLTNEFVNKVSFSVKKGETLGVAGLMGSGRTELMRSIFGIHPLDSGVVEVEGKMKKITSPAAAYESGIAYVSEDRKSNGIITGMTLRDNMTLSSLKDFLGPMRNLNKKKEEEASLSYIKSMSIKTAGTKQQLRYLSGGNQQKVSIAKNLLTKPKVLILDEPTRGVDVGARKEIYDLINELKKEGLSIIVVSSDIPEVLGISDRIMVMHEGSVAGFMDIKEATQEKIMTLAVGKEVSTK